MSGPTGERGRDARVVVLLRGINLGRRNRVPMAGLREALTEAGSTGVSTYVASGNVFLDGAGEDPDQVAARVRALVADRFEVDVPCLARLRPEVDATVAADPLGGVPGVAADPARHSVVFLDRAPEASLVAGIDAAAMLPARFAFTGRELHTWSPEGLQRSRLAQATAGLGVVGTARNWRTVLAIQRTLVG